MSSRQSSEINRTARTLLLAWFVAMVIGWLFLTFRVPILFQGGGPGFQVNQKTGIATLHHHNDAEKSTWTQKINFDVQSGLLDWNMSRELDDFATSFGSVNEKKWHRILDVDSQGNKLPIHKYRVVAPGGSEIPDRYISFPQRPFQIEDQFIVAADVRHLLVSDYTVESPEIVKTYDGELFPFGEIRRIYGVRGFLKFEMLPIQGGPASWEVKHYTIEEDLTVKLNSTWPAKALGTAIWSSVSIDQEEIASFHPTNHELEFRHSGTGKLIDSMPLPAGMDLSTTMPCYLGTEFFRIDSKQGSSRYLDLKRRKWLPMPEGRKFSPYEVLEDQFILFHGLRERMAVCKVFDLDLQKFISSFEFSGYIEFIDGDSILNVDAGSGLNFRKFDLQTGKLLESWKPFQWVIPLTSLLCIAWLAWSWLWKSGQSQSSSGVWLDIALVALVPLLLCIVRVNAVGPIEDLNRIPTRIAQGILFSFMTVGAAWLIHTDQRIVPRVLPILFGAAILTVSVAITFRGQYDSFVPIAVLAFVPVSGCVLCFGILRYLGYRLLSTKDGGGLPKKSRSWVTIRDMLVLTAVLAMLFAGLGPWLPSIGSMKRPFAQIAKELLPSTVLSLPAVVAWCLAMSNKQVRWIGNLLFLGAFTFFVVDAAWRFAGASSLFELLFEFSPTVNALPAMCFVATYWIASCFQIRGWRFTRVRNVVAN